MTSPLWLLTDPSGRVVEKLVIDDATTDVDFFLLFVPYAVASVLYKAFKANPTADTRSGAPNVP